MKTVVNVYKDSGLWRRRPPGFGDYLRGCAWLVHASMEGPLAGRFVPGVNLDLAPGSACLERSDLHVPGERTALIEAEEHVAGQGVEVADMVAAFLESDADTLYLATNESWRGLNDEPTPDVMDRIRPILKFTPPFARKVDERRDAWPEDYIVLHIRDANRADPAAPHTEPEHLFRERVQRFIELRQAEWTGRSVVCVSNNEALRDELCDVHGFFNPRTAVENRGFQGTLSEAELMDIALIKHASALQALSYYRWNSGFSVWAARLLGIPASFSNSKSRI